MTNGEKLKEIFPDGVLTSINNSYYRGDDILVSKNWWNAEYKEPNKSEIPTGSIIDWNNCHTSEQLDSIATTKNDLGVDLLFVEFKEKLSKWLYHNSESVCGNDMIDIDYLEGHIDEILYEMGIIGEVEE